MADNDRSSAEVSRLRARIATLEQLLEVYEASVLEQSDKLYAEQGRMRLQTTLLESQGEASLDGVLSVSVGGYILFANHQLAEMWGVDSPLIGTQSYQQTLTSMAERCVDRDGFLESVATLEADEQRREKITLLDGRTFERYTAPIATREGELLGRVWHFRDISAFEEIARMKDEFISVVSHELRTPMTSIRGSLDLMLNGVMGELPSEAMALTKIAQSNCTRLVRLINDVLDVERIEAGRLDLHLAPVDLEAIVEQSVESMRPYAAELGVALRIDRHVRGAWVHADADRLIQVMENLLSNAAKFSPSGETVRVDSTRSQGILRVAVADRGPGIPPEHHDRLFERFAQIDSPDARKKEGTGLGLNIALAIVEQHGGKLDFTSKPGAGTLFYFELPELRTEASEGPSSQ